MKKQEVFSILICIILMAFIMSIKNFELNIESFIYGLLYSFIIISVWVAVKKISAYRRQVKIEHSIWKLYRYGLWKSSHFNHPFPMGLFFPVLLSLISGGFIKALTLLQFNSRALPSKITKTYGNKRFSDVMEWDDGIIAFWGIVSLLLLSIICLNLTNYWSNFLILSKYALYFAIWNIIPFSQLDGTKIFFCSSSAARPIPDTPLYIFTLLLIIITAVIVLF